jgi:hypothetical protein
LDRQDDHPVFVLEEHTDDDHPAPRAEHEPKPFPTADEFWTDPREAPERLDGVLEPRSGVPREAV